MRIPVAAEEHHTLAVSGDAAKLVVCGGPGGEAAKAALLLEEVACPGYSAADCAAEVRGRTLHLTARKETTVSSNGGGAKNSGDAAAKKPRLVSALRRSVLLPAAAPAAAVEVVCANGVLRASVPRSALAVAAAAVTVPVSETVVAVLELPSSSRAAVEAAEGKDAMEVEAAK